MRDKGFAIGLRAALTILMITLLVASTWAAPREKVLHSFNLTTSMGGERPYDGLALDDAGNLYGTTSYGGSGWCNGFGCGTVFELTPKTGGGWMEKVLYSFENNGKDGNHPYAGLVLDAAGNLYGTTLDGGAYGYGTVFELTLKVDGRWRERILHEFGNGKDGNAPYGGLIFDSVGNLYGTTLQGGTYGTGTVFELTRKTSVRRWREKILHNFPDTNGKDGYYTNAGLILDAAGNLHGTTRLGGAYNCGTVFELTPKTGGGWREKVLHHFLNKDGERPYGGLAVDPRAGNLYGTTFVGGAYGVGTVFEITP